MESLFQELEKKYAEDQMVGSIERPILTEALHWKELRKWNLQYLFLESCKGKGFIFLKASLRVQILIFL